MWATDQPGCCGVAARLPKNPGTQKLTPPSSARATCECPNNTSANNAPIRVRYFCRAILASPRPWPQLLNSLQILPVQKLRSIRRFGSILVLLCTHAKVGDNITQHCGTGITEAGSIVRCGFV